MVGGWAGGDCLGAMSVGVGADAQLLSFGAGVVKLTSEAPDSMADVIG